MMFYFVGRPDGIGNRIEELMKIQDTLSNSNDNTQCTYYWNNDGRRKYECLIYFENIVIEQKKRNTKTTRNTIQIRHVNKQRDYAYSFCFTVHSLRPYDAIIHIRGSDRLLESKKQHSHPHFSSKEELGCIIERAIDFVNSNEQIRTYAIVSDEIKYVDHVTQEIKKDRVHLNYDDNPTVHRDWIDYYYLNNSSKFIIMASKYSSFSITASKLSRKKLVIFPESEVNVEEFKTRWNVDFTLHEGLHESLE